MEEIRTNEPEARNAPVLGMKLELDLQRFAGDSIDFSRITYNDGENDVAVFRTLDSDNDDAGDTLDESSDAEEISDESATEPLFMPRLTAVDTNIPHTTVGELLVRDTDDNLVSVTVDKDGVVQENPFLIGEDNLEDGTITGSKLADNTITSRELDMEEIFSETALIDQLLAANIDAEALFENEGFVEKFDERADERADGRIEELAVQKSGDTMTGSLVLPGFPTETNEASTKGYVDNQDLLLQYQINDLKDTSATTAYVDGKDAQLQTQINAANTSLSGKVSKAGDTMTGALTLSGDPMQNLHAATKQYVDSKAGASSSVVTINPNNVVFLAGSNGSTTQSTSVVCKVIAYTGTTKVTPTVGSVNGMPSGMSVVVGSASGNEIPITITVSSGTNLGSSGQVQGVLNVPITSPISTTLTLQWCKVNQGATGSPGTPGTNGSNGSPGPMGTPYTAEVYVSGTGGYSVSNMTSSSKVFVSPQPSYYTAYCAARVYCSSQTSGMIYFTMQSSFSGWVNVVFYN